jgi:hypothetical protein
MVTFWVHKRKKSSEASVYQEEIILSLGKPDSWEKKVPLWHLEYWRYLLFVNIKYTHVGTA